MIALDEEFSNPRLARIYDHLDGDRDDLKPYAAMVDEFHARSILDFGCGTGELLSQLAGRNLKLIGVDPAKASLDVAQTKNGAGDVDWILGGAAELNGLDVELAFITGNAAQVFLTDESWLFALQRLYASLRASGHLVFEVRDPSARGWTEWTRAKTHRVTAIEKVGEIESWCEVTDVSLPYVSFEWTYVFREDGAVLNSRSTLRFRDKEDIRKSLVDTGFELLEIRDAPDRPGEEFVFIAMATSRDRE